MNNPRFLIAGLLLLLSVSPLLAQNCLVVNARVYVSEAAAKNNPDIERKIHEQFSLINSIYKSCGAKVSFVPYKIPRYSGKTPWEFANNLGHLRGCPDLYTPDGKNQYPADCIMKYPYGVKVFSPNAVSVINRYAVL